MQAVQTAIFIQIQIYQFKAFVNKMQVVNVKFEFLKCKKKHLISFLKRKNNTILTGIDILWIFDLVFQINFDTILEYNI